MHSFCNAQTTSSAFCPDVPLPSSPVGSSCSSSSMSSDSQKYRNPMSGTRWFSDGSVEFEIYPTATVRERYAILTEILRNKQFSAHWTVKTMNNRQSKQQAVHMLGNLTAAAPELLKPCTCARILIEPPCSYLEAAEFALSRRSRSYDFEGVEKARFEVQRIVLTHSPAHRCSLSINSGKVFQATAESLPELLEEALALWMNSKMKEYEQPVVTVTIHSSREEVPITKVPLVHGPSSSKSGTDTVAEIRVSAVDPNERNSITRSENVAEQARLHFGKTSRTQDIQYIAPKGCERQSEIQKIYGNKNASVASRSPISALVYQHIDYLNNVNNNVIDETNGTVVSDTANHNAQPHLSASQYPSIGELTQNLELREELQQLRTIVRRQNLKLELLSRQNNNNVAVKQ